MTSSRPYLLRAIYEWLLDNQLTPYILSDATQPEVVVPEKFVENGKIVLNIAPEAVRHLRLGNDAVEFDARFSGLVFHVWVPIAAVESIYAQENGRGMVFPSEEDIDPPPASTPPPVKKGKPKLSIVK